MSLIDTGIHFGIPAGLDDRISQSFSLVFRIATSVHVVNDEVCVRGARSNVSDRRQFFPIGGIISEDLQIKIGICAGLGLARDVVASTVQQGRYTNYCRINACGLKVAIIKRDEGREVSAC